MRIKGRVLAAAMAAVMAVSAVQPVAYAEEITDVEVATGEDADVETETGEVTVAADDTGETAEEASMEDGALAENEILDNETGSALKDGIEVNVCVNEPRMVWTRCSVRGYDEERITYTLENENEDICEAEIVQTQYSDYICVNGKKAGNAVLCVKLDGEVAGKFNVHINEKPSDAVDIEDIWLRSKLINENSYESCDSNNDGSLDLDEMENITQLYYLTGNSTTSIKSLKGLEYATNLSYVNLYGNTELTDIDALFEIKNQMYSFLDSGDINLKDTGVSDDDRWKLADFKDIELIKSYHFLYEFKNLFDDELKVEVISGEEYLSIEDSPIIEGATYDVGTYIVGKEAGTSRLRITYKDKSIEINVNVVGIDADQPLGEESDVTLRNITGLYDDTTTYIDSNNNLWFLPDQKPCVENVKDYPNYRLYTSSNESEIVSYALQTDNTLSRAIYETDEWGETTFAGLEKLAENVVKCDARYALDEDGVLYNIYNSVEEEISGVKDWISTVNSDGPVVFILKNDGTLWTRTEVLETEKVNTLVKLDSEVSQVLDGMYVKEDGSVVLYDGTVKDLGVDTGVKEAVVSEYYNDAATLSAFYGLDGNFYAYFGGFKDRYIDFGKIQVKDFYNDNYWVLYVLTEDGKVYKYDDSADEVVLFLSDVAEMNDDGLSRGSSEDTEWWAFKLNDGTYVNRYGKTLSRVILGSSHGRPKNTGAAYLILNSDGETFIEREGIRILDNVKQLLGSSIALRTDGTVWNIWDIPWKIANLNGPFVTTGDVTGDDEINLYDLMMLLNHVAGKTTLADDVIDVADVNGDGNVDLFDLMRLLNYVSGKTETL